ncbi:MAG: histidine--tRNA ligase [Candidatus Omnitrophica bacterium]|nr:histidine--tRNA ligase [Candidatus Omnitrophota bacterium]
MSAKYQVLKGMVDLLPGEIEKWQWLEEKARVFLEAGGYKEIRTPIVEPLELFSRSLGEGSDIVHKEMYAFEDRGGRKIALRPEMTASVARAVLENHLLKKSKSLRLYYLGPMFRAERPQAGRRRQFHQIGIELVNESGPAADGEVISLLWRFLHYAGLDGATLKLNHLGCSKDRPALVTSLKNYFSGEKAKLCAECHYRLEKNVLRIFDCKNEGCQPVIQKAPWEDFCSHCRKNFDEVKTVLKTEHGITPQIERRLVRGLDYYTGSVFEVTGPGLGAQDAVAGGGRYDSLYESLGGESVPATGFSIGLERLLTALEGSGRDPLKAVQARTLYIASLAVNVQIRNFCRELILNLREAGFPVETHLQETSLSEHLKRANRLGLRHVLIAGESEVQKGKLALKDLEKHTQQEIDRAQLVSTLKALL